jgi:hypothetical protein
VVDVVVTATSVGTAWSYPMNCSARFREELMRSLQGDMVWHNHSHVCLSHELGASVTLGAVRSCRARLGVRRRAILVLDASGSVWGQIDEQVEIALSSAICWVIPRPPRAILRAPSRSVVTTSIGRAGRDRPPAIRRAVDALAFKEDAELRRRF